MKKLAFLLAVLSILVSSCSYGNYMLHFNGSQVDDRISSIVTIPASELPAITAGSSYSFLIIADAHYGSSKTNKHTDRFIEKFTLALENADETKRPRFIINLGDIMDDGLQSEATDYLALEKKLKVIAKEKLGLSSPDDYKTFSIIGNHDLYDEDGWETWKKNFYPATKYRTSYFRFTLGSFSYYFLDTGNATLGLTQLEDLEKQLPSDSNPKIVFQHYPIVLDVSSFCLQNTLERNRLMRDFARSNVRNIFTGHYHPGNSNDFGNFVEKTVKSFGYNDVALLVTVDDAKKSVSYEEIKFSN